MIMATKIPQTPHTLLEQIICDADLDYLGRNDFEPISRSLYKEFLTYKIIPEDIIWDHIQIKFFESHHYFTGTSISKSCLLYTSDAADERSSVDLGGRR